MKPIKINHYISMSDEQIIKALSNMIDDRKLEYGEKALTEIQKRLTHYRDHEAIYNDVDCDICWKAFEEK